MLADLRSVALVLITGGAVAIGAVACSDDRGDGPAAPTPSCQVLWATEGEGTGLFDLYLIHMAKEAWGQPGPHEFSMDDGVFGLFFDEFDESGPSWSGRSVTTGGTFTVSGTGGLPVPGSAFGVTDDGQQRYFALDSEDELGDLQAQGGAGSFTGVWSEEDDAAPEPGEGTISLTLVNTTALTLGSFVSYGQCLGVEE